MTIKASRYSSPPATRNIAIGGTVPSGHVWEGEMEASARKTVESRTDDRRSRGVFHQCRHSRSAFNVEFVIFSVSLTILSLPPPDSGRIPLIFHGSAKVRNLHTICSFGKRYGNRSCADTGGRRSHDPLVIFDGRSDRGGFGHRNNHFRLGGIDPPGNSVYRCRRSFTPREGYAALTGDEMFLHA